MTSPTTLDTGIRDLLSRLRATADNDTHEVLSGALNIYSAAMIRFRGNATFGPGDTKALLGIWQTLLDIPKANPEGYAPRGEPQPGED